MLLELSQVLFKLGLFIVLLLSLTFGYFFFFIPETRRLSFKIFKKTALFQVFWPFVILFIILLSYKYLLTYLPPSKKPEEFIFLKDFIGELGTIIITYLVFFFLSLGKQSKKENINESSYWGTYMDELERSEDRILALCANDFDLFFEPLGVRYFFEQAKNIKPPIKQRIVVLPGKSIDDPCFIDLISRALLLDNNLNDYERTFYNIYGLHKQFGIKLYVVPKKEIWNKVKGNSATIKLAWGKHINESYKLIPSWWYKYTINCKWLERRTTFKILDTLIIDNKCWYPTNKGKSLIFRELSTDFKEFIEKIFEHFTKNDTYEIETIKTKIKKTK